MAQPPQKQRPEDETNPEDQFEVADDVASFYCDSFHLVTGVWGTTVYLAELRPGRKPVLHAKMKVSPQMLRAISILTRKHVKDYEKNIGAITLPNALVHDWGVEEELK